MSALWLGTTFIASVAFIFIEYLSRTSTLGLPMTLLRVAPLAVIGQTCLYYAFQNAPSWMMGWFVFAIGTSLMRVTLSHFLAGEPVSWLTLFGVLLMLAGGLAIKSG